MSRVRGTRRVSFEELASFLDLDTNSVRSVSVDVETDVVIVSHDDENKGAKQVAEAETAPFTS